MIVINKIKLFNPINFTIDRVFFQSMNKSNIQIINDDISIPNQYIATGITVNHNRNGNYYQNSCNLTSINNVELLLELLKADDMIKYDLITKGLYDTSKYNKNDIKCTIDEELYKVLSKEIPVYKHKVSKLGKIISFSINIQEEKINSSVYLGNKNAFLNQTLENKVILMDITLEIDNHFIPIKRELNVKEDNIVNALNSMIDKLADEILPYKNKGIIVLGDCTKDIILKCGSGGIFIHEAIGHALEADAIIENDSIMTKYIGKKVMDSNISIIDRCTDSDEVFYSADSYGDPPKDINLVENGIISDLLSDRLTARELNLESSGNGRVENFDSRPLPRMRNTFLKEGVDSKQSIIKNTQDGVYAIGFSGGQTNTATGDFVFYVNSAYQIKNGELTNLVKPFMYVGNIFDSLNRIDAIGNDLEFQSGYCGKKGQLVKVSYGQPTIKIANQSFK